MNINSDNKKQQINKQTKANNKHYNTKRQIAMLTNRTDARNQNTNQHQQATTTTTTTTRTTPINTKQQQQQQQQQQQSTQ